MTIKHYFYAFMMNNQMFNEHQVLTCSETGGSVRLVKQIERGFEGAIWEIIPNRDYVAKLYHELPSSYQCEKLKAMVRNPPDDPTNEENHVSIAWPKRLLEDDEGNTVGFLMPYIKPSVTIPRIYNLRYRQNNYPGFNWRCLHGTAQNLASIVWAIHSKGHVLCDISDKNLLVNPTNAYISIIDTDSFQIVDGDAKKIYPSLVLGTLEYMPPELQNLEDTASINKTEIHDRFSLAVIIHRLLFGYNPFHGGWPFDDDEVSSVEEYISKGYWLHGRNNNKLRHPKDIIPIEVVHPEIQDCFYRCFDDGYKKPSLRPTARDWFFALEKALADLKTCDKEPNHFYSNTYSKCYWCEDVYDRFPSVNQNINPTPDEVTIPTKLVVEIVVPPKETKNYSPKFYDIKALSSTLLIALPVIALIFWLLRPQGVLDHSIKTPPTVNVETKSP
ncbi:WD-40 repeat protein [Microseira wollei NIES-4236]|uniref:WD-40 repeat protein n=2 Tax=Microseira wollei TaxID=467598 RepID=A0AAV3XPM0_9CYAN|nr:WD-40 repeat protein [Microseira wollei NIES-4236]